MAAITQVQVPGTRRPVGHYSQAVVHGGLVFVAGQLPIDLASGELRLGTIEEQTDLALGNIDRILAAAGSGLGHALQLTIYLADIDQWPAMNSVYARHLGDHRPARAVVPIAQLHYGVGIEIVCVAAVAEQASAATGTAKKPKSPVRRKKPAAITRKTGGRATTGKKPAATVRRRAR